MGKKKKPAKKGILSGKIKIPHVQGPVKGGKYPKGLIGRITGRD